MLRCILFAIRERTVMARYKQDQREEYQFLAASLDTLLPEVSVARDIAAALERLDFAPFDEKYSNDEAGCTAIDPRSLAGVIILGLLRGVTSSVRLAALCECDIEFRWISGGVRVEKSTLCAFRKGRLDGLAALGAQVLGALGGSGLLPGEHMGVDGTIVRAAASCHSRKKRKHLKRAHEELENMLHERLESEEPAEAGVATEELKKRRDRLNDALEEMSRRGLTKDDDKLTVSEAESGFKRQKDGSFAPSYNAQVVSDLDSGAIVSAEIVDAGNDCGQLKPQMEQARAALREARGASPDKDIASVTADGAYHDTRQLAELEGDGIACHVPDNRNTNWKAPGIADAYQAQAFVYDEDTQTLQCPEGQTLFARRTNKGKTAITYQAPASVCAACPAKEHCFPNSKCGRSVNRTKDEYRQTLRQIVERLDTPEGKHRLRQRWTTGEGAFARLCGQLHWRRNRMWGMEGAKAELAWRTLVHNLLILAGIWKPMTATQPVTE